MSLAAIAAAATAAAAAEERRAQSPPSLSSPPSSHADAGKTPARSRSLLSDSTDADMDPFESDSSGPRADATAAPGAAAAQGHTASKKRRGDPCAKPELKKASVAQPVAAADAFPAEMLLDLAGSTSAEVRRMNDDEKALVHYKRRLRNRESAKRSRARRQATISDIQVELEDLREVTASLVDRCVSFARMNDRQSQELETLRKEKQLLESMLRSGGGSVL